jgi:short-subunit dehydrogenase
VGWGGLQTSCAVVKAVFITGAAHGIGQATARLFAANGWFVGLYDINVIALERLATKIGLQRVSYAFCDVSKCESVASAITHFSAATNGRMDVLVNNAGVLTGGAFELIDSAANDAMIDVNTKGVTNVCQLAFPLLRGTAGACVINLSSASSIYGVPQLAVYSASKYFVSGLSLALGIEWREHGIRVVAIKPPVVKTAMGASLPEHLNRKMASNMTPEYVARQVLRAVSGKHQHYILGFKAQLWSILCKLLPLSVQTPLMRLLADHEQRH